VRKSDSPFTNWLVKTASKTPSEVFVNLTHKCFSAMVAYTQHLTAGLVLSLSCLTSAYGQPPATNITSTTGGGDLGTTVTQMDNVRDIVITGGTRPGNGSNLFHSFQNFSIGEGDIANFLNHSGNGPVTENILSRVTGGTSSEIYGTIKTTDFQGANLYLMNPAGVIFGPSAKLEVEGSFHATTADYLRFEDGTRFNANPIPPDEVLSVAPVAAFGFLEANPEQLSIKGGQLLVPVGETLSMVSGDMAIGESATLSATEGQVNLVSAGSAGEVILRDSSVEVSAADALGRISLSKASIKGGRIVVRGEELAMVDGEIRAVSRAIAPDPVNGGEPGPASTILIEAEKSVAIDGDATVGSGGTAATTGAGSVHIESKGMDVTVRESDVFGDSITIAAAQGKVTIDDTVVVTDVTTDPTGSAGPITIRSRDVLVIGDRTRIGSNVVDGEAAGSVTIMGASKNGTVEITGDNLIGAFSEDSSGSAGVITISAQQVTISGTAGSSGSYPYNGPRIVSSTINGGPGGSINITGTSVTIKDGSEVSSKTDGNDRAGSVTIMAPLENGTVLIAGRVKINANTGDTGAGGELTISGGDVLITENQGGSPFITAETSGLGPGGNVSITAGESITLTGDTRITSSSQLGNLDPDIGAGTITLTTPILFMAGGRLQAETAKYGPAGDIVLNVGIFEASGGTSITSSSRNTSIDSGRAGNIIIRGVNGETDPFDQSHVVTLVDSAIRTESSGGGAAGSVSIVGSEISLANTEISTVAKATGAGGHIALEATGVMMKLTETNLSAEVKDVPIEAVPDTGLADITLKAPALAMVGGSINAQTTGTRDAGAIILETANAELSGAELKSSSESGATGDAGRVIVRGLAGEDSTADWVKVIGGGLSTSAVAGQGGDIAVTAGEIMLQAADVSATVSGGKKPGGAIELSAGTRLDIVGGHITAESRGDGAAGAIALVVENGPLAVNIGEDGEPLSDRSRAIISTRSTAVGSAGNISISALESSLSNTEVSTVATGTGRGGHIVFEATGGIMKLAEAEISVEVKDVPPGRDNPFIRRVSDADLMPELDGVTNIEILPPPVDIVPAPDIGLADITLKAPGLEMVGGRVNAQTSGTRDGGAITLEVATVDLRDAELTSSSTSTAPHGGQPGSITILKTGSGPADRVTLTDSAVLTQIQGAQGGRRPSEAAGFGQIQVIPNPVDVGQIQIITDTLRLDGSRISGTTAGRGDASVIRLWANEIELQGSEISSSTSAVGDTPGDAGQVFIRGAQGEPSIANRLALVASEIRTGTTGDGLGGQIEIDAVEVSLSDGSEISASTASVGSAGSIGVTVDKLSSQGSLISSISTRGGPNAGAAGSIRLTATDTISIDKGGLTTVANGGAGGSIDVAATNAVTLSGTDVLATVLGGEQPGGGVTLSAPEIRLTNGTAVAAESGGTGTAGAIAMGDAGTSSLRLQNSTVSTNAAEAKGGDINVQAQEVVHMTDSAITTSVGAGEGQGGNIFIDPQYVILNASRVQANAVGGPGGRIEIISDIFIASADSVVEAVSEANIQGVILISAPERDVVSGASVLPAEFQDPSRRLRARCGQRVDVGRSNFQEVGLEGLPPSPDDYLWVIPLLPEAKADGRSKAVPFIQGAALPLTLLPCTGY